MNILKKTLLSGFLAIFIFIGIGTTIGNYIFSPMKEFIGLLGFSAILTTYFLFFRHLYLYVSKKNFNLLLLVEVLLIIAFSYLFKNLLAGIFKIVFSIRDFMYF